MVRPLTADKRMPLVVPRVGEGLKGGRMKKRTGKENPQHKRSRTTSNHHGLLQVIQFLGRELVL